MGAQLFAIAVTILIAGVVWFFVVRPILEDYGIIRPREAVNHYPESDTDLMSRAQVDTPPRAPSSLEDRRETDARQTPIVLPERKIRAEELLTLYALMRRYNIPRDVAAAAFKAVDLPFNNNVWTDAAPDDTMSITPIAGRPTPAKFHDDPELEYQPLR